MEVDPRVRFSLERTLLSWIRTSIALIGFGFLVARLSYPIHGQHENSQVSLWIGISLILAGIYVNFSANQSFNMNILRIKQGLPLEEGHWTLGKVLSIIISILSLIMVIYLIFQ